MNNEDSINRSSSLRSYESAPQPPKLIHCFELVDISGERRTLELLVGDVTGASKESPIDMLVVSAFPNSYDPTLGTVIRCLSELGINLELEAGCKLRDWRPSWQCWISKTLGVSSNIRQLVCFEHGFRHNPEDVIGNVFRAIREFLLEESEHGQREIETLRLPLLSTGYQGGSKPAVLTALVTQAMLHLAAGLPVRRIQLVLRPADAEFHALLVQFGTVIEENKNGWHRQFGQVSNPDHDMFVSYRHTDTHLADKVIESIKARRPDVQLFIDHENLQPGSYWKPSLIQGMARCHHALCLITDTYSDSSECMDEFHAALFWNRHRHGFLVPLLSLENRTFENIHRSLQQVHCIPAKCPPLTPDAIASLVLARLRTT